MGGILGLGFLHMVIAVFLMAWVVSMIPQLPDRYGMRVVVVGSIGLVAAVGSNLGDPIWYNQPWSWHVVQAVYDFTFWIVAGLAIAWFVRSETPAEATA